MLLYPFIVDSDSIYPCPNNTPLDWELSVDEVVLVDVVEVETLAFMSRLGRLVFETFMSDLPSNKAVIS